MNLGISLFQYNTSVFFRQTNIPTQICSQLTLLTSISEVGRFLRQRLKPWPRKVRFKERKPRPSDSERCPVFCGVIIIFKKKQKRRRDKKNIHFENDKKNF